MRWNVPTRYMACTVVVTIRAIRTCNIYLEAWDAGQANTYFMRRYRVFNMGEVESLYVQMPISGRNTIIRVVEDVNKDFSHQFEDKYSKGTGRAFDIISVKQLGLNRKLDVANMTNAKVRHFVRFAQRFCFNAGVMPTYEDRYYTSDNKAYKILFTPTIVDDGKEVLTPARIDPDTAIIDVSKSKFLPLTVPIRFCILCHEFSHLNLNEDKYNELEADLNGLTIYLGLGYPVIEATETFQSILEMNESDENYERYERVCDFIDHFNELKIEHL